jgi:hypothetical protein
MRSQRGLALFSTEHEKGAQFFVKNVSKEVKKSRIQTKSEPKGFLYRM